MATTAAKYVRRAQPGLQTPRLLTLLSQVEVVVGAAVRVMLLAAVEVAAAAVVVVVVAAAPLFAAAATPTAPAALALLHFGNLEALLAPQVAAVLEHVA